MRNLGQEQLRGDLRTEASRMRGEEAETVPTDNSEILLERETERSGGSWRGCEFKGVDFHFYFL